MGFDYALVHLFYTLPPAFLLSLVYGPLFTGNDAYKLVFLILVAVVSTIPWDSYLIRNQIWGYPSDAVLGPTFLDIPIEELFFFVIQTYCTSLLYLLLSKPVFHVIYLRGRHGDLRLRPIKWLGATVIVVGMALAESFPHADRRGEYLNLIFMWAGPFLFTLWLLAYQFLILLPLSTTLVPILLPTVYLWIIDTIALRRGTWVIEDGTKLGWYIWPGLEIEEAIFFLITNTLVVFGQVAFDNALAVLDITPSLQLEQHQHPSPTRLVKALLIPTNQYDAKYIQGLREALDRLQMKSRSFYLASGVFPRALRRDLIFLYSYCRAVDDLIDEAPTKQHAKNTLSSVRAFLGESYDSKRVPYVNSRMATVVSSFPPPMQSAFEFLPTTRLSPEPLYDLLKGFDMDLLYSSTPSTFPIVNEQILELYATRVASTVAEMCLELVFFHEAGTLPTVAQEDILQGARRMGVALQYVNIARDIGLDSAMGRVYVPTDWLSECGIKPEDIIINPRRPEVGILRQRLLKRAFLHFSTARPRIELLPPHIRGCVRVMIESYMEIGRTLQQPLYQIKDGRATVGRLRRLWVAWKALNW